MLLKTGWILFFLTIKVFKDDVNLLANVTFPSPRTADVFPVIVRKYVCCSQATLSHTKLLGTDHQKSYVVVGNFWAAGIFFFVIKFIVIFPCANISFFCTSPPPPSPSLPPYIVSNGPLYGSRSMYESQQGPEICDVSSAKRYFLSL